MSNTGWFIIVAILAGIGGGIAAFQKAWAVVLVAAAVIVLALVELKL